MTHLNDVTIKHQRLPDEFAAVLQAMRQARDGRLSAVLWLARANGWTLQALGAALGVGREAVRQRIDVKPFDQYPSSQLPPIPLPPRRVAKPSTVRKRLRLSDEFAADLRRMWTIARTVNGVTPLDDPSRQVSEEFTAILNDLWLQGVALKHIAERIGVRPSSIAFRLSRHGYRPPPPSQEGDEAHVYRRRCVRKDRAA